MGPEALQDLMVVDVTGSVATAYCGKLFAALGARVVNAEPPRTGHPTRALAPFVNQAGAEAAKAEDVKAAEASAFHAYLSPRKHSVELDIETAAGQAELAELAVEADLMLEGFEPGWLERLGVIDILRGANRDLLVTSISWFGQSGPLSRLPASDALIAAMTGQINGFGPAEGPPMLPSGCPAQILAGTTAFVASLGSLCGRAQPSTPKASGSEAGNWHLDVSVYESCLCLTEPGAVGVFNTALVPPRLGINRFWPTHPASIYRCKDDTWLGVTVLLSSQWQTFCRMLELPALAAEPRYQITLERVFDADLLDPQISAALSSKRAEDWFREGQEARVPLALVPTMKDLLRCEQFTERGAFSSLSIAGVELEAPAVPFRLHSTKVLPEGEVATLGQHNERRAQHPGRRTSGRNAATNSGSSPGRPRNRPGLLSHLRVVDLSMGWAGPLASRHLADMGAEVIKVESCRHFDWWRGWDATPEGLAAMIHERAPAFNMVNRNKLGITLDLTSARGAELLLALVKVSDVVIENFAASVLPKLGLGYEVLSGVKPDLLMLSMPPFGASGPWQNYRAYGSTVEQASGLPHLQGEDGDPPTMQHVALGDPVAGVTAAAALMAGIWHRERTGAGQLMDLSQVESLFPLGAHGLIEQSLGDPPRRPGRRRAGYCPHGVYPCQVEDSGGSGRWIVIAISKDEQWKALANTMAAAREPVLWAQEERFAAAPDRLANYTELEELLGQWTSQLRRDLLAEKLQRLGIPCAPVLDAGDLLFQQQLVARGFWQWLDRDHVGTQPNPSAPYRWSGGSAAIDWPAPTLGQHNSLVLSDLLGLKSDEIDRLERQQIIGTLPLV